MVVGHWQDPACRSASASWARAAAAWHEAHRLKVARFGDNMRQVAVTEGDKVEAQVRLGFSVNGYGVGDLVAAVAAAPRTPRSTRSWPTAYERLRRGARACGPAATSTPRCARRRGSRSGLRRFLEDGGFQRLHGHLRGPAAARRSCPAWPCSA